ncbi:MAG: Ribosomal RNA small subunit methyltransferase D [Chlamydiia bacterium]|nr:Ribosomal RNA small subunit methyltransferase D [Chlamydiia bacterium]MCH9616314.1 Ribosomal RNA small subunit methyltransferase D [Chlamydiia bacterium]MCH9629700.1 Ribosomal RNA small subunit methyltransferase D [Chlamydiia bacterium]
MRITGGRLKGRQIKTPSSKTTRPTQEKVREAVFNMLQFEIEGATFLDIFAGSGAVGIEALSRGAKSATFIESDRSAANILKSNLNAFELNAKVIVKDAALIVPKLPAFDIVFLDPPYGVKLLDLANLVKPNGTLLYESSEKIEIPGLSLKKTKKFGDTYLHIFLEV